VLAHDQRITPNLWFDDQAEEAARFYVSIFKDSELGTISRYGAGAPKPEGSVLTVSFTLEGQRFVALNGGPQYTFTEAVSFVVHCRTQDEVDHYWERLSEGGPEEAQICGWLKDRYGVSWQIVPDALMEYMGDPDPAKAQRTFAAMMQMKKLDIAALRSAHDGADASSESAAATEGAG
jgi:predicted 3-demethylubiquinone-9 3-methyltransferase (glyoxalase superfamily)